MESLALILVLISAILHAIWNLFTKKSIDKMIFLWFLLLSSMIIYFPFFIYLFKGISKNVLTIIVLGGTFNAIYIYFVAKTYQNGNLSLTYPLIRSSTIFIPILAYFFIGENLSIVGIFGIIIVLIGMFSMHLDTFDLNSIQHLFKGFLDKATIFALLAALFSAFYAITDKIGMRNASPFTYEYLRELTSFIIITPLILKKKNLKKITNEWKQNKATIIISGILMILSYVLILMAMQIDKVSYIISLRQISIIFGVLLGIVVLKEKHGFARIISSSIMFIGFILISIS